MDFFEQWDEAKWHFTYGDESEPDNIVLQGGLVIVLYLVKSYLPGNRELLASAMNRVNDAMGGKFRWGYWEHPKKKGPYTRQRFDECMKWVSTRPSTHVVEFAWSSGPGYDFVGDYAVSAFSQMGLKEEEWRDISHFQVYLPVEFLRGDGRVQFEKLVRDLASMLPVLHGYAGLGFQQSNEFHRYENLELELAEQFLGFEVADVLGHDELRDGFKSVNWYTILHKQWLEKLGGRKGLEQAVQDEAAQGLSLLDFANGVIVKAGEWPALGWVERDPQPAAYVAANHILRPARAPMLRGLHMGSILGEVRFDQLSTDHWFRRFDAPGIWSMRTGSPEIAAPAVETPEPEPQPMNIPTARVIRAEPGESCPRDGDWFSPYASKTVHVQQGEPMRGPAFDSSGNKVIWYLRLAE
jgi:hypothetical protein